MGDIINNNGIGFCRALTLLFIGLKLTNYINWSWWWVLSPLWGSVVLIVVVLIILFILVIITDYFSN